MLSVTERTVLYAALLLATVAAWSVTWMQSSELPAWSPFLAQALCGGAWTTASVASSFADVDQHDDSDDAAGNRPDGRCFATIARRRRARREPYTPTLIFVAGYCLVWSCFSARLRSPSGSFIAPLSSRRRRKMQAQYLLGWPFSWPGFYQFTPVKTACLRGCRSPLAFIMAEWREGYTGALLMGLRHGLFCVGCCWALMSLMFCVSVMDLRWAAAFGVYAAVEKIAPGGDTVIAPAFGSAAILGGAALLGLTLL